MQQQNNTPHTKSKRNQWLDGLGDDSLRRIAQDPTGGILRDSTGTKIVAEPEAIDGKRPKAERTFSQVLRSKGVHYRRTGYPDYAILDAKDGIPIGFIEVKRGPDDQRRYDQIAFARFCEKFSVPYALWWPGLPLPKWLPDGVIFGAGRVLKDGERAGVPRRRAPRRRPRRDAPGPAAPSKPHITPVAGGRTPALPWETKSTSKPKK